VGGWVLGGLVEEDVFHFLIKGNFLEEKKNWYLD
jgi:hypothetical protein